MKKVEEVDEIELEEQSAEAFIDSIRRAVERRPRPILTSGWNWQEQDSKPRISARSPNSSACGRSIQE